jgi:hypothetical protein
MMAKGFLLTALRASGCLAVQAQRHFYNWLFCTLKRTIKLIFCFGKEEFETGLELVIRTRYHQEDSCSLKHYATHVFQLAACHFARVFVGVQWFIFFLSFDAVNAILLHTERSTAIDIFAMLHISGLESHIFS